MPLDFTITALVTLLVVVDPVGLAPTFLAVTEGLPDHARKSVAIRATVIAGAILIGSALIGDWLLRALGISLPAFRIGGGLLLFAISFEMVFGARLRREGEAAGRVDLCSQIAIGSVAAHRSAAVGRDDEAEVAVGVGRVVKNRDVG